MSLNEWPFRVFDAKEGATVVERRLPHWSQPGTLCFITFRTCDSLPKSVIADWLQAKHSLLVSHGINPLDNDWRQRMAELSPDVKAAIENALANRWHENLDACHGECVLRDPEKARIVAESLLKFDGHRYDLTDFVVMPNHVHVLTAFPNQDAMLTQCESWKRFMAREINRLQGTYGRFWQQDAFDHLVRTLRQFEYLRDYIQQNPSKAKLTSAETIHWRKAL